MQPTTNSTYALYSDGGYFEKQDIGGWGWVMYKDSQEIYRDSGWQKQTSSLEMELMAAKNALEHLAETCSASCSEFHNTRKIIYTDSRVLIEGLTEKYDTWCQNQWRAKSGKTIIYKPLWQRLFRLTQQQKITWKWVKGHNGNEGNTIADDLARTAVNQRQLN